MAEIKKAEGKVFLELNEKEKQMLGTGKSFFELNKVKNVFLLTESELPFGKSQVAKTKEKETKILDEKFRKEDEKIFELLSQKGKTNLSMKVEGEFEKQLSEKELKRFNELLKEGIIEKFKLNESYKKAIYQIAKKAGEKKDFDFNSEAKTIEANGFEIMANENQARNFCEDFSAEIKEGQIRGIKGFDGYFYAIHLDVLEELKPKILAHLKEKTVSAKELSEKTSLPMDLIRGTIEFLKEDGEVIEKRKGIYQRIE